MKKRALEGLTKSVTELKRILEADADFSESEQLFLQNHLLMLQMAFSEWKLRKNITN